MPLELKNAVFSRQQAIVFSSPPYAVFANDESFVSDKETGTQARILVVEDDYLIGVQIEAALTRAGFEVAALVSSGKEAIEIAATELVSLAIMDIRLAGNQDGVDTAIELFRKHGIRCVFATAHSDATVRARAEAAQPLGWVSKPYSMATLLEAIRAALKMTGRS
jgi:two-component system, response regulator PdtaR